MSFSENMILHIHETMTNLAGYELSGKYKTEDNLIMEIDERGRRRVRFTPVSAAETGEAMQQLVLAYMDARDNPKNKQIVTDSMCDIGFFYVYIRFRMVMAEYPDYYHCFYFIKVDMMLENTYLLRSKSMSQRIFTTRHCRSHL